MTDKKATDEETLTPEERERLESKYSDALRDFKREFDRVFGPRGTPEGLRRTQKRLHELFPDLPKDDVIDDGSETVN